ncbi:MAG: cytochrome ubiquinol oxidase subunit I, partial [Hyphomicrobiales bacterium]
IHDDFTAGITGPGMLWPMVALALFVLAWGQMLLARHLNARGAVGWMRLALFAALVLTACGALAGLHGPWSLGMDPTRHVYPAIVWVLVLWTAIHAAVGMIMQLYCLARSFAGRLTTRYDMDLHNVVLYWHFMVVTALSTFAVVGLFPEMR